MTWFEVVTELRINLDRSKFLLMVRAENGEVSALELGCKVGALPSFYLGFPLGASHKFVTLSDEVERFHKRLSL